MRISAQSIPYQLLYAKSGDAPSLLFRGEKDTFSNRVDEKKGTTRDLKNRLKTALEKVMYLPWVGFYKLKKLQPPQLKALFSESIAQGYFNRMKALMALGAPFGECDASGQTVLMKAVQTGNLKLTEALLQGGADVNEKDKYGCTLLMKALGQENTPALLKLLVAHGADLNAVDQEGETALMHAVWKQDVSAVKTLLTLKAPVDAEDKHGATALMIAAGWSNEDIYWFSRTDNLVEKLHSYATPAKLEILNLLISAGADVNKKDGYSATPLMRAAFLLSPGQHGLKALLAAGATLNERDTDGWTALSKATAIGNIEGVKVLLDAGANPFIKGADGRDIYGIAMGLGQYESLQLLMRHYKVLVDQVIAEVEES